MTDKAMSGGISTEGSENGCLTVVRYGRFWAVYDNRSGCVCCEQQSAKQQTAGQLVCVTVYRKGAREVVRRLEAAAITIDEE